MLLFSQEEPPHPPHYTYFNRTDREKTIIKFIIIALSKHDLHHPLRPNWVIWVVAFLPCASSPLVVFAHIYHHAMIERSVDEKR